MPVLFCGEYEMGNTHREVPQSEAAMAVWVQLPAVTDECSSDEVTAPQASECC